MRLKNGNGENKKLGKCPLRKCPVCGGRLYLGAYCQYTRYYPVRASDGAVSDRCTKVEDAGTMEMHYLTCEKTDCFATDCEGNVTRPWEMSREWHVKEADGGFYLLRDDD